MVETGLNLEPVQEGGRKVSIWVIAILLVVVGIFVARLVRATLAPALRHEETLGVEMHWV